MTNEKQVALRLVETILAKGWSIIHDYGDVENRTIVYPGGDMTEIENLLGCSEQDWLYIRGGVPVVGLGGRDQVGTIYLLWGNADDGSELVCDHTANPETEEIVREAYTSLGLNTDIYCEAYVPTALEKIENLARPGQELDIHDAIDILCTIYNIAKAERRA